MLGFLKSKSSWHRKADHALSEKCRALPRSPLSHSTWRRTAARWLHITSRCQFATYFLSVTRERLFYCMFDFERWCDATKTPLLVCLERQVSTSVSWEIRQTVQSSAETNSVFVVLVGEKLLVEGVFIILFAFSSGMGPTLTCEVKLSWKGVSFALHCVDFCCCSCVLLRFPNLWTTDPVRLY